MEIHFKCPVCGELLFGDNTLRCNNNHCFDKAKQGYVNLLRSNKSSKKRHGDDALMVNARKEFLDKGYYDCLADAVIKELDLHISDGSVMADLGCGECWYTSKIYNHFLNKQESVNIYGIDISKTALIAGAKRCSGIKSAVASIFDLPIPDECCDAVINIFAPYSADEVLRIVKRNGVFIKAVPLERHLIELKSVIYDRPYENKVELEKLDGFKLINQTRVEKEIHLSDREDIMNLFKMTPYYYKTGRDDQQKISMLTSLDTTAQFLVETFIKSV